MKANDIEYSNAGLNMVAMCPGEKHFASTLHTHSFLAKLDSGRSLGRAKVLVLQ